MEYNSKKARGQKHHHNKARYQNKAKVAPKATTDKESLDKSDKTKDTDDSKKALASNWHRYDELPSEESVDDSTNFSLLAQAPVSHGGHFQFKSDKNIESEFDFENFKNNKMFSLDLHMLECSLSTILFHERCGLDKSYFTESQLIQLDKRSQQNQVQYESYLKLNSIAKEFSKQVVTDDISKKPVKTAKDVKDDVDFLLDAELSDEEVIQSKGQKDACLRKEINSPKVEHNQNEEKKDLEDWLDDILND